MAPTFRMANTVAVLRSMAKQPYDLGLVIGELLHAIPGLVSSHLDHDSNFYNSAPKASIDTCEFAAAVDNFLYNLRTADGVVNAFPDDLSVNRKQRKLRREYRAKYIDLVEKAVKNIIMIDLKGIFIGCSTDAAQMFNKGLDYGLNMIAWRLYPSVNVVLEAHEEDWSLWLRVRCEELGKRSIREGKSAFDAL